jgi:hypothetical protein
VLFGRQSLFERDDTPLELTSQQATGIAFGRQNLLGLLWCEFCFLISQRQAARHDQLRVSEEYCQIDFFPFFLFFFLCLRLGASPFSPDSISTERNLQF